MNSRSSINIIGESFRNEWCLGRYIILCWTRNNDGIDYLAIPYYSIGTILSEKNTHSPGSSATQDQSVIHEIIKGSRYIDRTLFERLQKQPEAIYKHIGLPDNFDLNDETIEEINELLRRYSISYVKNHAVALFDIVGFSTYDPFAQITLLSSLSYSINSAHNKLLERGIEVEFTRTTTGDGFYIWTREPTIEGNVKLYTLIQIVLADNAIARTKTYSETAPVLKTAFHIGDYYEFYQSEKLKPTAYSFIVGDVTIELARIIERASPQQILVGDFTCHLPSIEKPNEYIDVNTVKFIEILKERIDELKGLQISDKEISSIVCYLTGEQVGDSNYTITRYQVIDKHNKSRIAYNAKVNIYRKEKEPVYLGLQEKDVRLPRCSD